MNKSNEKDMHERVRTGRGIMISASIVLFSLLLVTCNSDTDTTKTNTGTQTPTTGTRPRSDTSFFVTSVGLGNGANLGGIPGADKHCQSLATAVGLGNMMWRAYLSNQGANMVNARDRIGNGPWTNAKWVTIAQNIIELHGANNITKETALNEKGEVVKGRWDTPNMHDMLTGSQPNGTAFTGSEDRTCGNWTKSSGSGAAMLGHSDRMGTDDTTEAKSWNSSHLSRGPDGGCSQNDLKSTGGDGLFYCFAVK